MIRNWILAGAFAPVLFLAPAAQAEPLLYGIQAEQLEVRVDGENEIFAWDLDAFVGKDELKFVLRSEGEYEIEETGFETLENQARLQMPFSDFYDAVAGVRVDTPDGPDRIFGVVGVHGLAQQWFEIDADLFFSDEVAARFEIEYEGLITNRIILTPSIELDLPFTDDEEVGVGAWGPTLEAGLRLSYDLIDRSVAPYIGVHYERSFGDTADFAQDEGEEVEEIFFVAGIRLMF